MGAKAAGTLEDWLLPGRTLLNLPHRSNVSFVAFLEVRNGLQVLEVKVGLREDKDQCSISPTSGHWAWLWGEAGLGSVLSWG